MRLISLAFLITSLVACSRIEIVIADFEGPVFTTQSCLEDHSWKYDTASRVYSYKQSGWKPSFLYKKAKADFLLEAMLRLPVHGGGLRLENDSTLASLMIYDSLLRWSALGTEDQQIIDRDAFPLELSIRADEHALTLIMRPYGRESTEIGTIPASLDSIRAGLYVEGFGGFHFENVRITEGQSASKGREKVVLEVLNIKQATREVIVSSERDIKAVCWEPDSNTISFISEGHLENIDLQTGVMRRVSVYGLDSITTAGYNAEKEQWAITGVDGIHTRVYLLPLEGGRPQLKTVFAPSVFDDWSNNGEWLVYSATRKNTAQDIYRLTRKYGREERLTAHDSLDGGAAFGMNEGEVFFHSNRHGMMQVYRWSDGSDITSLVSKGQWHDWYPQPSPDGKYLLVYSTKDKLAGTNNEITLRLYDLSMPENDPLVLDTYRGIVGDPVINPWSPSGDQIVFVSTFPRS